MDAARVSVLCYFYGLKSAKAPTLNMPNIPADIGPVPACVAQAASDYSLPTRALLAVKAALQPPELQLGPGLDQEAPFPVSRAWLHEFSRMSGLKPAVFKADVCWTARATAYVLRYEINLAQGDFWTGVSRYAISTPPGALRGSEAIERLIENASLRIGLDPQLVRAVVQVESAYRPDARSPKGAIGLMQLMPATAALYGVNAPEDLLSPVVNIEAGVRHLRDLMQTLNGDVVLTLAAYNAGLGAVLKAGNKVPPFPETQRYIHEVTSLYGPFFKRRVYEASERF